jgi:flagellar protein FliS
MNNALANYQKNQVAGMSQKDMIILLYSGAIKFLDQANEELDKDNTEGFADKVERVHRIVYHLYTTLDFDEGGEIAEKLGSLYSFVIGQLYILNSTRNPGIISDVREILSNLKEGWQSLGNSGPEQKDVSKQADTNVGTEKVVSVQV